MNSHYVLTSRWSFDLSRDRLWGVVDQLLSMSDPLVWWPSVQVRGYDGRSMTVTAASAFGYALTFRLAELETNRPTSLAFVSTGDLSGRGTVSFVDVGPAGCAMDIDWQVTTDRPWMRRTGWLLRPVFVVGHHLVMRQGQRHFSAWLEENR